MSTDAPPSTLEQNTALLLPFFRSVAGATVHQELFAKTGVLHAGGNTFQPCGVHSV